MIKAEIVHFDEPAMKEGVIEILAIHMQMNEIPSMKGWAVVHLDIDEQNRIAVRRLVKPGFSTYLVAETWMRKHMQAGTFSVEKVSAPLTRWEAPASASLPAPPEDADLLLNIRG